MNKQGSAKPSAWKTSLKRIEEGEEAWRLSRGLAPTLCKSKETLTDKHLAEVKAFLFDLTKAIEEKKI